jgi:hypothetical protein
VLTACAEMPTPHHPPSPALDQDQVAARRPAGRIIALLRTPSPSSSYADETDRLVSPDESYKQCRVAGFSKSPGPLDRGSLAWTHGREAPPPRATPRSGRSESEPPQPPGRRRQEGKGSSVVAVARDGAGGQVRQPAPRGHGKRGGGPWLCCGLTAVSSVMVTLW